MTGSPPGRATAPGGPAPAGDQRRRPGRPGIHGVQAAGGRSGTYTALVRSITGSTVASGGSSTNTWNTTLDSDGTYYLRAKATDAGGAVSGYTNLGSVAVANTKGYQMII